MKKKKLLVSIVAALLALLMVFGIVAMIIPTPVSAESSASIKKRIEALEDEKDEIDAKIKELEGQINENFSSMEEIVAQKDLIDQEIFLLNQQIINLNNQIVEYGLLIADKQDELEAAEAHLAQLQEQNKDRIRAMEKNGDLSYWSVLFHANSFVDLLDRLKMIEEIAEADKLRLEEMQAAAQVVASAKAELEDEKTVLEGNKEALNVAQAELDGKRAEADVLLAELVAIGQEYEALLEEEEDKEAELLLKIAKAEGEYKDAKAKEWAAAHPPVVSTPSTAPSTSAPSSGGWIVPCSYTKMTSPFGSRIHPIYGYEKMHYGVDLAGIKGTPIYAADGGKVTYAGWMSGYGYLVKIDHQNGYVTYYGHCSKLLVKVGDKVPKGTQIAKIGSTGTATGNCLHFEVRYKGVAKNPLNYLP